MKRHDRSIFKVLEKILVEIRRSKKWWLLPLWILLAALGLILVASGSAFLIPAIYMAF